MGTTAEPEVGAAYLAACRHKLAACHRRVRHCIHQLTDDQVWWRPSEGHNSIANLVLHLCGNVRQWVVSGVGGTPDVRNRPQEFGERRRISREELLRRLEEVVSQADTVLSRLTTAQLLEPRRIQGFDESVLSAIFDSLAHFNGHTQEIVFITRLQLGDRYEFAWKPASPEQGAPTGSA
jgi:hypothetical protein